MHCHRPFKNWLNGVPSSETCHYLCIPPLPSFWRFRLFPAFCYWKHVLDFVCLYFAFCLLSPVSLLWDTTPTPGCPSWAMVPLPPGALCLCHPTHLQGFPHIEHIAKLVKHR